MTILSMPVMGRSTPTKCTLSLVPNTQTFESPLNKTVQTYELPGARWHLTATWENRSEADSRIFKAWLAKLRGAAGRFYAGDFSHMIPGGTVSGSGYVYGASQSGSTVVSSWTPPEITADTTLFSADDNSVTIDNDYYQSNQWLLQGDYVCINGELKIITGVIPLINGLATLDFEPPLRGIPADNSAVVISAPVAVFRLLDDQQDKIGFDPERICSITIEALEVFQ